MEKRAPLRMTWLGKNKFSTDFQFRYFEITLTLGYIAQSFARYGQWGETHLDCHSLFE